MNHSYRHNKRLTSHFLAILWVLTIDDNHVWAHLKTHTPPYTALSYVCILEKFTIWYILYYMYELWHYYTLMVIMLLFMDCSFPLFELQKEGKNTEFNYIIKQIYHQMYVKVWRIRGLWWRLEAYLHKYICDLVIWYN